MPDGGGINKIMLVLCLVIGIAVISIGGVLNAVWKDTQFVGTPYEPPTTTPDVLGVEVIQAHNWHSGFVFMGIDPISAAGSFIEFLNILWICMSLPALIAGTLFGLPGWVSAYIVFPFVLSIVIFLIFFLSNRLGWSM